MSKLDAILWINQIQNFTWIWLYKATSDLYWGVGTRKNSQNYQTPNSWWALKELSTSFIDTWPVHKQDNCSLKEVSGTFSICNKAQKSANTDWLIANTEHRAACGTKTICENGIVTARPLRVTGHTSVGNQSSLVWLLMELFVSILFMYECAIINKIEL